MNTDSVRTVPNDYCYKWVHAAWIVAKKHYGDCLTIAILSLVAFLVLGRLNMVGSIIIAICSTLLSAGCLICTNAWLKGDKAEIKDFFQVFQNSEKIKFLAPFIAFQIGLVVLRWLSFSFLNFGGMFSFPIVIDLLISFLIWFTLPLMVFKEMPFGQALSLSINAVVKNIVPLLLFIFVAVGVALISTLLLVIPLVLVVMPAMVVNGYIIYATIFEGLNLATILPVQNPPAQL